MKTNITGLDLFYYNLLPSDRNRVAPVGAVYQRESNTRGSAASVYDVKIKELLQNVFLYCTRAQPIKREGAAEISSVRQNKSLLYIYQKLLSAYCM
jgi:hypothetical protein